MESLKLETANLSLVTLLTYTYEIFQEMIPDIERNIFQVSNTNKCLFLQRFQVRNYINILTYLILVQKNVLIIFYFEFEMLIVYYMYTWKHI